MAHFCPLNNSSIVTKQEQVYEDSLPPETCPIILNNEVYWLTEQQFRHTINTKLFTLTKPMMPSAPFLMQAPLVMPALPNIFYHPPEVNNPVGIDVLQSSSNDSRNNYIMQLLNENCGNPFGETVTDRRTSLFKYNYVKGTSTTDLPFNQTCSLPPHPRFFSTAATFTTPSLLDVEMTNVDMTSVETQSDVKPQVNMETQVDVKTQVNVETQADVRTQADVETQADVKTPSDVESKVVVKIETQPSVVQVPPEEVKSIAGINLID